MPGREEVGAVVASHRELAERAGADPIRTVATATSAYVRVSLRSVPQNQWCLSAILSLSVPAEKRCSRESTGAAAV